MKTSEESKRSAADGGRPWELTANHAISLPLIDPETGALHRVGVLHRGANGIVEWAGAEGEPLLCPVFEVDGEAVSPAAISWERLEGWIPRFTAELGDRLRLRGTICAPAGYEPALRGAVYTLELDNRTGRDREIEVALAGTWGRAVRRIVSERAWGERRVAVGEDGLVLECGPLGPALAVCGGAGSDAPTVGVSDGTIAPGAEATLAPAAPAHVRIARRVRVAAGKRGHASFFLAVGPEADGALAAARELRRIGGGELVRRGRLELARLARTPDDTRWAPLLNRALFFNYFFAVARAVDDDRLYPVSSRSPLFPAGAVFRERDALLWSLPALTLLDPWLAHEMLLRAFEQYAHHAGEHVHYIDGGVLAPGFALDQACAYGIALERYVRDARDEHAHEDPLVQDVLRELDEVMFHRLHPEIYLAGTELLPSGDAADHPYVTYDNALLCAFARALPALWVSEGDDDRPLLSEGAEEIRAAVWHDCTVSSRVGHMLAWSVDLEGEAAVYDDPGGSLALLPYLGFCEVDDPVWQATMEFLRSARFPFWHGDAAFPGSGSRTHPEAAAVAALCSELLGPGRAGALELLKRLPGDVGIACEAWDPKTGEPALGLHYAALAGFLGWALWHALEGDDGTAAAGPPASAAPAAKARPGAGARPRKGGRGS